MQSQARVPIAIEQDPARFRPNDTPLVLGDHRRLTRRHRLGRRDSARPDGRRSPGLLAPADRLIAPCDPTRQLDWRIKSEIMSDMATVPLLFDLGRSPTTRDVANSSRTAASPRFPMRSAAAMPRPTRKSAAAPRSIACKGMPFMQVDAQSVSRLHARLPLLLRAEVPAASRARRRRSVRVGDFHQDQLRRGAAARARQAVVDEGVDRLRHGDRSVSADRRHLQDLARRARSAARCRDTRRHRHQGTDDRARQGRAAGSVGAHHLPRAHQHSDRRRRRVGEARAWRRASDAAAARGARAGRCRHRLRRADGADRARVSRRSRRRSSARSRRSPIPARARSARW